MKNKFVSKFYATRNENEKANEATAKDKIRYYC